MNVPTLESERLILRGLVETDAHEVQRLAGAFEIADTTLNIPHPYEDGLAESWIKGQQETARLGKGLAFAIVLKSENRLVGVMSLMGIETGHQAELGYWVGLPYWGSGICTEAGHLVVDYALGDLGLLRLYARHLSRNPSSGRVLKKLGFEFEGSQHAQIRKWDKLEDVELYGLISAKHIKSETITHLVALNIIQSEECDGSGEAFPHIISRLFEDGAMTFFSMCGWSKQEIVDRSLQIASSLIKSSQVCRVNHSVAVYCKLMQSQADLAILDMRLVSWPENDSIATAKFQISMLKSERQPADDLCVANTGNSNTILMRRFTARHRGQAGHINIQHFAQSADDACRSVASLLGVAPADRLLTFKEKIRFRAEMHPGDCAFVRCAVERQAHDRWLISGEMVRLHDEALVCQFQRLMELPIDEPDVGTARQSPLLDKLELTLNDIPPGEIVWGPRETYRGTVEPMEVNSDQNLSTRALWDKMTRALWSVQNALGASRDKMREEKLAAGASMFQLQFHEAARLGTPLVIRSSICGRSDSSLRMQHQVCDARDNSVRIEARYVLTFFNRKTGKRSPIPSFIAEKISDV